MPIFLISLGLMVGYLDWLGTGNLEEGGKLFWEEFRGTAGKEGYYKWFGAIILIALLGYIPEMRPIALGFLILITVSVLLKHGGPTSQLEKSL